MEYYCNKMILALFVLVSFQAAFGWYLPGSAPTEYAKAEPILFKVDKLTSAKTQLPYSFYHLAYCRPQMIINYQENLGEILKGDMVQNSVFDVRMKTNEQCKLLCVQDLTAEEVKDFKQAIDDEYMLNILADNLPAAMTFETASTAELNANKNGNTETSILKVYSSGLPVGILGADKKHFLFNHWDFTIRYQNVKDTDLARVVGFEATPRNLNQRLEEGTHSFKVFCGATDPLPLENLSKISNTNVESPKHPVAKLAFTYSVRFLEGSQDWSNRWNTYLLDSGGTPEIHWFSIVNSIMVVLLLSGVIGMILLRTLLRDIARYNQLDDLEDVQEETGWKLVHGDVFRRPNFSKLLAVCAATGIQLITMSLITLILAAIGFLSPSNRGSLVQCGLILFALMGTPAGFVSARFNKLFDGEDTTRSLTVTLMTALQFPGVCFMVFLFLNLILWHQGSSGAIKFSSMFLLLLLWFGISVPLVFIGSYYGYKKPSISLPVRTNQIPRQIPPSHWLFHPIVSHAITGVLPFCAVFTELLFILSSVWQHKFYYLFGFMLLVVIILIITCAEISIAYTYFQLCAENYQWWWRSYWASAASAIYVFLYGIFYFHARLNITRLSSIILYFGYTFLMSYTFFLLTGAVGFISTFFFIRAIYGAVKVD